MIKKVGNWVFGSFFRTMGRFFFFLFFGFMLAMIISKNNISIKWTDLLGIEMVKADTYQNAYYFTYYSDANKSNAYNSLSGGIVSYVQLLSKRTQTPSFNDTNFYFSSEPDVRQYAGGYISFPFEFTLPIVAVNNQTTTGQWVCTNWTCDTTQQGVCARYNCTGGGTLTQNNSEIIEPQIMVQAIMYYTNANTGNQSWRTCQLDKNSNSIRCPLTSEMQGITRLRVSTYVYYSTDYDYYYNINIGKMVNVYADGTQQAIQDQTQQQQQQHNETISTITDTNTTEASSEATNFFGNFTSQDNGGISSIITAPLSAISGLVSASCNQIVLPIPYLDNKQLVLPCMSAIYTEHFGAFFTIYQTIIFGAIAYRIVVSLFMMIQGFKNPDDDKIEVVDL